jgi:hypothetical protein
MIGAAPVDPPLPSFCLEGEVVGVSVASEFEHAVQVLDDVALLHRMAEGTLMSRVSEGPPGSCWSTGAESCRACRSRSPHSCWSPATPLLSVHHAGVVVSARQRLRHEVTMEDDLGELGGELTAAACSGGW